MIYWQSLKKWLKNKQALWQKGLTELEKEESNVKQLPAKGDSSETALTPLPVNRLIFWGGIVLFIFFGTFVLWAGLATLEAGAVAPGYVTVQSFRKNIQHLEGGIVRAIYVKNGEHVKAGQALMQLDDTRAKASLGILKTQMNGLLTEQARLIAERDGADKITWPKSLLAQKDDPDISQLMSSQESIFKTNKKYLDGQLDILNQRVVQLEKEIESLQAQVDSETKQLSLIQEEVVAVEYLEKKKLIDRPRLLALKREKARLGGNRGEHLGLIAKAQQKIGETKQQIITVKDNNQKEILKSLDEVQNELADVKERYVAAEDTLKRTTVIAPQDGVVLGLQQHTIGGVIAPGGTILELVPSQDKLIVEARINPLDIDVMHLGLTARIRLTALKQRHTPILTGKVIHISADRFVDEKTQESYYKAYIAIETEELKRIRTSKLYPGMPVTVMIVVDKRTPINYFLTPILESFWQAFREQ